MKKLFAGILTLGLCITSPAIANAQRVTEFVHRDNSFYRKTLNSKRVHYYKYKTPAYTFGVFTLKNYSRRSDFDIHVFNPRTKKLLEKGEKSGTGTELVVVPNFEEEQYVYIAVSNYGSQSSQYQLYANYVSPANKFAIAVLQYPFCNREQPNNTLSDATVAGVFSILQQNDPNTVAKDVLIAGLTTEMRRQFGYGCEGELMVNFGVSIISGFFRNY